MSANGKPLCPRCTKKPVRSRGLCANCYGSDRSRVGWQSSYVDAQPVRDHILALRAAGISNKRLRELSGVSHNTIQVIITGRPERGTGPTKRVWRRTAAKLLAVPIPEIPHRVAAAGRKVPALGTRRRLQALVAAGYSRRYLCARIGMAESNGGRLWREDKDLVLATTARAVDALFAELQMQPGPSSRARNEGRRRRWPLPLDWDEDTIDDPAAAAVPSWTVRDRRAEQLEDIAERRQQVRRLTGYGLSAKEIAERLGISDKQVERDRAAS